MAGAGYKLFTTGQVLTAAEVNTYLQEQTVMVFNDAASRTTALSGVLAEGMVSYLKSTKVVEIYNGTAWASLDDPNAIQNTIVDAKGDLIAATGNDVPARLAVGNNGETLVADSSATTGLRWQGSMAAGRNIILNGGFDCWQRGTSFALVANTSSYVADRFMAYSVGAGRTVSRQTTSDTTNLPFIQYSIRLQRDSGNTATNQIRFVTSLESVNSIPFAGKTVAFSFYARAGANYSGGALTNQVATGTGTDQNLLTAGYTGLALPLNNSATLTTTWQRFSYTGTIASTATEIGLEFNWTPTGTAGANDWVEITGIQLEVGSIPTQFSRAGGTLAGELAAAMRYFQRYGGNGGDEQLAMAQCYSTTQVLIGVDFKVPMRISPSYEIGAGGAAGDFRVYSSGGSELTVTALTAGAIYSNSVRLLGTVASGLVAGNASALIAKNTNGRLFFSAEL